LVRSASVQRNIVARGSSPAAQAGAIAIPHTPAAMLPTVSQTLLAAVLKGWHDTALLSQFCHKEGRSSSSSSPFVFFTRKVNISKCPLNFT
jgi:hypothetical protein